MSRSSTIKRAAGFCWRSTPISTQKTRARALAWGNKGHFYKPLPKEFRHSRFTYRQIAREDDVAIYEQTWNGCRNPSICYEVIRIRRRDAFQIGDRFVEAAEVYPNSDAWGSDGFTFTDEEAASAKLSKMAGQG